jgi:hypothetical protein
MDYVATSWGFRTKKHPPTPTNSPITNPMIIISFLKLNQELCYLIPNKKCELMGYYALYTIDFYIHRVPNAFEGFL